MYRYLKVYPLFLCHPMIDLNSRAGCTLLELILLKALSARARCAFMQTGSGLTRKARAACIIWWYMGFHFAIWWVRSVRQARTPLKNLSFYNVGNHGIQSSSYLIVFMQIRTARLLTPAPATPTTNMGRGSSRRSRGTRTNRTNFERH